MAGEIYYRICTECSKVWFQEENPGPHIVTKVFDGVTTQVACVGTAESAAETPTIVGGATRILYNAIPE